MRSLALVLALVLLALVGSSAACGQGGAASAHPTPAPAAPADASIEAAPVADASPDAAVSDRDRLDALIGALGRAVTAGDRAALVATFEHDVAYGPRGFPIRERGEITFVYWDAADTGGPLAVTGDLDGWSTTAAPMSRPVAAAPLWIATVPDPAPTARSLYKLVRAGTQFFADPWARRFGYDAFGEHSLLEAGTVDGHLERWPDFGDARGSLEPRTLYAWVPPGYDASSALGYPLLVMQDGQNLFDPAAPHGGWHVDTAANEGVKSGALRPFVVIAVPSSAHRFDEYTQTTDTLPGIGASGGQADAYASFVVNGVVPFARARYRLRADPAENAIAGSSLGGLVSLYVARLHPEVFGAAGSFSGTISWGSIGAANPTIRELYVQKPPTTLSLYLDSGGDDGGGCAALSALDSETSHDQYCETHALETTLVGLGWVSDKNLFYAWTPNATHDEAAWAARLPGALVRWFPHR